MRYFIVEFENGSRDLFYANRTVEKGDFVVVPNYNDDPVTAKVVELISRVKALKMNSEPEPIICWVDMKEFNAKREKELDDLILIEKMEKEIKRIQLIEKLEKYAGKDPKMNELYNALKGQTAIDDDTELEFR